MSTEPSSGHHAQSSSTSGQNDSSDLNFTSSSSSGPAVQPPQPAAQSTFQWPSEPLNHGRPSLPQESQKSVDDANRDISQRITDADHDANLQPAHNTPHPDLDHPRLSAQLAHALNNIEDDRRQQLSPTSTSFLPDNSTSLPMLSPQPQAMLRSTSNSTSKSAASDKLDPSSAAPSAAQYNFLPEMFRNAATMPINLLRSLIPDNAFSAANDEGLSASTLQVPVTSFSALFEACKALEWLATQAANFEGPDKSSASRSRRNSTGQLQSDDNVEFTYFDYFQVLQKVADVVSGLAASRGIDLVLDLDPKLEGQPAENQRNYKLGSCTVWADRIAVTFLFMSCISRLLHKAPLHSSVVITTTLTEKEETVPRPDAQAEMKLMVLSLGLRLILSDGSSPSTEYVSAIRDTPASLLLDAFGARLITEQSTIKTASGAQQSVVDHSISVPIGQLSDLQQGAGSKHPSDASAHDIVGPDESELVDFAASLKGKKVALYSSSQSLFARQLSTFLSGLGCDIAPVFSDSVDESSLEGGDQVFGKQAHTAVAMTAGRPALVSYTSDMDRRAHSNQPQSPRMPSQPVVGTTATPAAVSASTVVLDPVTGVPITFDRPVLPPNATSAKDDSDAHKHPDQLDRRVVPFSFVIIDDDIVTLQKELLRIRSAVPLLKSALVSKTAQQPTSPNDDKRLARPVLDHRTKSSPHVNRLMASQPAESHSRSFGSLGSMLMSGDKVEAADIGDSAADADTAVAADCVSQTIVFFTSMKSYRLVRDTVQPIIDSASFHGVSSPPEIMVLPKPAGAKRILTALHLAERKPVVKLPFLPIATSPLSPLTTYAKSWWTPDASQKGDANGIMTLTRRMTTSTDADFDTMPSTPWTPVDASKPSDAPATPQIPLTSETLPLAGQSAQSAGAHTTHSAETTKEPVRGAPASTPAAPTTAKTTPLSAASHKSGKNGVLSTAPAAADATSTQKSAHPGSAAASSSSPSSAANPTRSLPVNSPMPADALEYFSETAAKMGGSAASGMVIQSPDGRPAGIFFQPKGMQSNTSLPGSKPALSRGVSASSLRRSIPSTSEHGDSAGQGASPASAESGTRERRLTGRSTASSAGSARGGGEPGPRGALPILSESLADSAPADASAAGGRVQSNGKYASGSMFAPQVGIQSVMNSSRPPVTTPLGTSASSASQDPAAASESASLPAVAEESVATRTDSANADTAAQRAGSAGATKGKAKEASPSTSAIARKPTKPATPPTKTTATSAGAATALPPKARTASAAAAVRAARPSVGSATASPSDARTKPSAVAQSGFMMGMGFTASARRGRGPKKAPVREAVLPPIKVLIVEDNPINQRILSMFMRKKSIKYDVANNGREAVDKWNTGGYHLILMDIQLPVMDGIEATKEIRKLERQANIGILPNTPPAVPESRVHKSASPPSKSAGGSRTIASKATDNADGSTANGVVETNVGAGVVRRTGSTNPFRASVIIVALTASVLSSDRVEALAAGCNDFLNKPVSLPWLNQKILEWGSMMYLMYSGLSTDDVRSVQANAGRGDKAQLHLGFGYGPAEKAKALANNLHLGDTLAAKKKKKDQLEHAKQQQMARAQSQAQMQHQAEARHGPSQEQGQGEPQEQEQAKPDQAESEHPPASQPK